jgi:hypothetical protein
MHEAVVTVISALNPEACDLLNFNFLQLQLFMGMDLTEAFV